jgi:STAM-binding protein
MIKMGRVYEEEGNLEAAYVLYLKYITLFLEKINTHRSEQKANCCLFRYLPKRMERLRATAEITTIPHN